MKGLRTLPKSMMEHFIKTLNDLQNKSTDQFLYDGNFGV